MILICFLPKIEEPFDYEFEPNTFFASGAIEEFLNKLNVMFRQGNFAETYNESGRRLIGLAPASSGVGVRRLDGSGFFVLNLSDRKHIKYYLAKEVPDEYISFTTDGSTEADLALLNEVTNGIVTIITNENDVEYWFLDENNVVGVGHQEGGFLIVYNPDKTPDEFIRPVMFAEIKPPEVKR